MWLDSIERIYLIKKGVKEASDIDQTDLDNFHKFLLTRIQVFMMKMAEYVDLEKIIEFLADKGMLNTY